MSHGFESENIFDILMITLTLMCNLDLEVVIVIVIVSTKMSRIFSDSSLPEVKFDKILKYEMYLKFKLI